MGIVGEIYVKYSKMANNGLEDFLAEQDCEVCVPGIMGFAAFKVDNRIEDYKMFGGNRLKYEVCKRLLDYVIKLEISVILGYILEFYNILNFIFHTTNIYSCSRNVSMIDCHLSHKNTMLSCNTRYVCRPKTMIGNMFFNTCF